jgi:hypothetical protein
MALIEASVGMERLAHKPRRFSKHFSSGDQSRFRTCPGFLGHHAQTARAGFFGKTSWHHGS